MGLDVDAYRGVKKLDVLFDANGEPVNPETRESPEGAWTQVHVNPDFPGRADDVEDSGVYAYEESIDGWSGGYHGYNAWRDELARVAGYPETRVDRYGTGREELRHDESAFRATSGPFWELICFSDCEGTIGAAVSKKLAKDFADFQPQADQHHDERWRQRYNQWRAVFEFAAADGFVRFH